MIASWLRPFIPPWPSGLPASRLINVTRRWRRPGRSSASLRRAAARRRRSSLASRGSSHPARPRPVRSRRSLSTSGPRRSSGSGWSVPWRRWVSRARGRVRVRTFHALGLEILRDAGQPVEPLVDRLALLRRVAPDAGPAGWRTLDTAISRLKLDLGVDAAAVAADPEAGPIARTFVAYEAAIAEAGGLDFDDLVARVLRTPRGRTPCCWSGGAADARTCSSTRRRISIAPSSGWRCSSPRRPTACSS